jgi:hypothetical protein
MKRAGTHYKIFSSFPPKTLTYLTSHRISRAKYLHKFAKFYVEEIEPFLPKPIKLSSSNRSVALLVAFIHQQQSGDALD